MREHAYTALPGRVERFDESKNAADVKPLIKDYDPQEDGSTRIVSLPIVPNVPILQLVGGGFRTTYPIAVGDTVLLVFARRSLDKWKAYGGEVDPADRRLFNLSDAVAIPGLLPFSAAWSGTSTTAMTAGKDGGPQVHFGSTDIKIGGGDAAQAAVLGNSLETYLDALVTALSTFATAAKADTVATVTATAATALDTALGTVLSALKVYKSAIVKVK
jgi:hypothetical protein